MTTMEAEEELFRQSICVRVVEGVKRQSDHRFIIWRGGRKTLSAIIFGLFSYPKHGGKREQNNIKRRSRSKKRKTYVAPFNLTWAVHEWP